MSNGDSIGQHLEKLRKNCHYCHCNWSNKVDMCHLLKGKIVFQKTEIQKCYTQLLVNFFMDWLVVFYDISTFVGYLMPNPVYTYILNIYELILLGFMAFVGYLLANPGHSLGSLTPLQRCSRCILQPQLTGQGNFFYLLFKDQLEKYYLQFSVNFLDFLFRTLTVKDVIVFAFFPHFLGTKKKINLVQFTFKQLWIIPLVN